MKNLLERIENIVNYGGNYEFYKVYFVKEYYINKEEKSLILTEDEFIALDNLYEGELSNKVLN